jgi:tape measure domain-containing protein
MFTVRRTVYGVTLALGGLVAAAGAMGFKFNQSMELNRLAFTRFLGSTEAADQELHTLFELAAHTPFEFTQVVDATRKFLAFGFSIDESNALLRDTADAVAGMGLGGDAIDRAVLALGQMRTAGRVLGQDLRQLQELGLFSPEDFQKRLGVGPEDFGQIGQLGIPSKLAIDAITAYWREKFGGASADFQKTFTGRLTTLRDYGSQLFGAITKPWYDQLSNQILPLLIHIAITSNKAFQEGGLTGVLANVDKQLGKGTNLAGLFTNLTDVLHELLDVLQPLAESFLIAWVSLSPGEHTLPMLAFGLSAIGHALEVLKYPLAVIIGLLIIERSVTLAAAFATKIWSAATAIATFVTGRATKVKKLYVFWMGLEAKSLRGLVGAIRSYLFATKTVEVIQNRGVFRKSVFMNEGKIAKAGRAMWGFAVAVWATVPAIWAQTIALLANPITWIILAAVALIAIFVILIWKWKAFGDKMKDLWHWLVAHWYMIPIFGTMIKAIDLLIDLFGHLRGAVVYVKNAVVDLYHWVIKLPRWFVKGMGGKSELFRSLLPPLGPTAATGVSVASGGIGWVGERGPELLQLPRGARVTPVGKSSPIELDLGGQMAGGGGTIIVKLVVDGRVLAETVARANETKAARR